MKFLATVVLAFTSIYCFSQEIVEKRITTTTYLPIKEFKKLGKNLTGQDSLNFKFHQGDTLVKMPKDYVSKQENNGFVLKYEYKSPEFMEIYKDVVYWKGQNCSKIWEDDIRLFIDPSIPSKHQDALRNFASGISTAVDSLKIREVQKEDDANFHVYYTNSKDTVNYEPRLKNKKSGYYVYWNKQNRLNKGYIKIDSDSIENPVYQLANLKFQFFKSLGMFGDSKNLKCASYLSGCNGIRSLTASDMEILKYHYSLSKPRAIDKENFEKFHREIPEIYRKDPSAKICITTSQE